MTRAALPRLLLAAAWVCSACRAESPLLPDADSDGSPDAEDCAPSDPAIHPGSADPWGDGADTNCDDSDGTDADGDGWPLDSDPEVLPPDCDDSDPQAWPGAREASPHDGIDSDCSGGDGSGVEWADVILFSSTDFWWGRGIAGLGDLDGDGLAELAIGQQAANDTGVNGGRVSVMLGSTLAGRGVFHLDDADVQLLAEGAWGGVGASVAGGGDFDGDGLGDVLVGAPLWGEQPGEFGAVYVVRGADLLAGGPVQSLGDAWVQIDAEVMEQQLGWAVAWVGDVDADGLDDALVGAPADHVAEPDLVPRAGIFFASTLLAGGELLLAGADILLERSPGEIGLDYAVGYTLAGLGDVDGDGGDDIASRGECGSVRVFYSSSLPERGTVPPSAADVELLPGGAGFGASLAGGRDIDKDGLPDLLVGQPADLYDEDPGSVYLVSGTVLATPGEHRIGEGGVGARLLGEAPGSVFGDSISLGDGDGDGRPELVVSAPAFGRSETSWGGRNYVIPTSALPEEGAEAVVAAPIAWEASGIYGPVWIGDLDGDGREDLASLQHGGRVNIVFSGGLP